MLRRDSRGAVWYVAAGWRGCGGWRRRFSGERGEGLCSCAAESARTGRLEDGGVHVEPEACLLAVATGGVQSAEASRRPAMSSSLLGALRDEVRGGGVVAMA